jgi:hypothetical protein
MTKCEGGGILGQAAGECMDLEWASSVSIDLDPYIH